MNTTPEQQKLETDIQIIVNFLNTSQFEEVIRKTIPLIKKYPNTYILKNLLALAYNGQNKYNLALDTLNNAIKNDPRNIFILNNLGIVHGNLENTKIAEDYLMRAISINPMFLDASITLANLKSRENKNEEAIKILTKLENSYKKNYILNFTLGNINQQLGNFDKALAYFNYCLMLDPKNTAPDKAISLMTKYSKENKHLKDMKNKFKDTISDDHKMTLSFALGKSFEDIKDYKNSFKYLRLANEIRNKKINYSITNDKKLFLNIKNFFKVEDIPEIVPSDKKIIFVLGMPRSGTSLIEQILSSHREVYGAGELNHIHNYIEEKFLSESLEFKIDHIDDLKSQEFKKFQKYYLEKIDTKKSVIIDKAPLNFKWIGFLLKIFPDCKIIHSKRDPMDICWSMYKNFFTSRKLHFCYDLNNLGKYYLLYRDLMSFWESKFSNRIYTINYENLIKDQKNEIEKLLKHCELNWDESCMTFYENKKSVSTASLAQVRNPIYKSSVQKWKNYSVELDELLKIINQ